MEGAEEDRGRYNISLSMDEFSRDLLQKFMSQYHLPYQKEQQEEKDGEIELSLGLSMNGRFGVDPTRKRLKRSSSISNLFYKVGGGDDNGSSHQARGELFEANAPLVRTCSLPSQTEEWRHQKVLQSTRSMEARKKRMEKLKNVRLVKDKENCLEDVCNGDGLHDIVNGNDNVQIIGNGSLNMVENGFVMPPSLGSFALQKSGSSGISDNVLGHQTEGVKQIAVVKSTTSIKSIRDLGEQTQTPTVKATDRDAKGANELLKNAMFDMPFVSTKGDGCNGNKIDGFLYRYKKGEEVRIVCVCHGMFLSPAEFVKHGGGGDVEHPLKHIVVNPSPLV